MPLEATAPFHALHHDYVSIFDISGRCCVLGSVSVPKWYSNHAADCISHHNCDWLIVFPLPDPRSASGVIFQPSSRCCTSNTITFGKWYSNHPCDPICVTPATGSWLSNLSKKVQGYGIGRFEKCHCHQTMRSSFRIGRVCVLAKLSNSKLLSSKAQ